MAHCFSVGVKIDDKETEICTSHVPGNEHIEKALNQGKAYKLTDEDVERAVKFHKTGKHKLQKPNIEAFQEDLLKREDDNGKP